MKNIKKIALISILLVLSLSVVGGTIAYAYISRERNIEGGSKVGHCQIISISNPTLNSKIKISDQTQDLNISISLDCNINAVVRVKIIPKYYDIFDRTVNLPNNIIYNTENDEGTWIADEYNMCFYYDTSVKDVEILNFINSISFDQENNSLYENHTVEFIIEADILQTSAIDYNNHPWKDNAPEEWLNRVKLI